MTWLTRKSFLDTASDLETDLLAQTEDESFGLLLAMLTSDDEEIVKHPLYKMWTGYEVALAAYEASLAVELATRGVYTFKHLESATIIQKLRRTEPAEFEFPSWLEDIDVLRSHRSNMARRWPSEYAGAWGKTPELWPYLWPFVNSKGGYEIFVSKQDKNMLISGERQLPKSVRERVQNL